VPSSTGWIGAVRSLRPDQRSVEGRITPRPRMAISAGPIEGEPVSVTGPNEGED
jgi:hypothetical protein